MLLIIHFKRCRETQKCQQYGAPLKVYTVWLLQKLEYLKPNTVDIKSKSQSTEETHQNKRPRFNPS